MATIARPKTLSEVRDAAAQCYADVMGDPRRAVQVHEGVNALGKSIGAAKVYLDYCALVKVKPKGDWQSFIEG